MQAIVLRGCRGSGAASPPRSGPVYEFRSVVLSGAIPSGYVRLHKWLHTPISNLDFNGSP